jgi:2-oxoglutarate ferredoxin oxidoreductase subunit alpha
MRISLKIAGETGLGVSSVGQITLKLLQRSGYFLRGDHEAPSTIQGGRSNYQINFDTVPIFSASRYCDIAVALDREGILDALETIRPNNNSILIHGFERWDKVIKDLPERILEVGAKNYFLPARQLATEMGGNTKMIGITLVGFLCRVLELDLEILNKIISEQFASKPQFIEINQKCARAGFDFET